MSDSNGKPPILPYRSSPATRPPRLDGVVLIVVGVFCSVVGTALCVPFVIGLILFVRSGFDSGSLLGLLCLTLPAPIGCFCLGVGIRSLRTAWFDPPASRGW